MHKPLDREASCLARAYARLIAVLERENVPQTHTELLNFDLSGKRRLIHATELPNDPGLFVAEAFGAKALTRHEIELLAVVHNFEVRLIVWGPPGDDEEFD